MTRRGTVYLRDDSRRSIPPLDPKGMRPLGDNVLLEVIPEERVRPSGIEIPSNVAPSSCQCRVVAIGPNASRDVGPGDHVLIDPQSEYNEETFTYDGTEYLVVPESNILGIVEGDA